MLIKFIGVYDCDGLRNFQATNDLKKMSKTLCQN